MFSLFTVFISEQMNKTAGLKFMILLPQPPEGWDYRHALLDLAKTGLILS
jgi:hypothetical protein